MLDAVVVFKVGELGIVVVVPAGAERSVGSGRVPLNVDQNGVQSIAAVRAAAEAQRKPGGQPEARSGIRPAGGAAAPLPRQNLAGHTDVNGGRIAAEVLVEDGETHLVLRAQRVARRLATRRPLELHADRRPGRHLGVEVAPLGAVERSRHWHDGPRHPVEDPPVVRVPVGWVLAEGEAQTGDTRGAVGRRTRGDVQHAVDGHHAAHNVALGRRDDLESTAWIAGRDTTAAATGRRPAAGRVLRPADQTSVTDHQPRGNGRHGPRLLQPPRRTAVPGISEPTQHHETSFEIVAAGADAPLDRRDRLATCRTGQVGDLRYSRSGTGTWNSTFPSRQSPLRQSFARSIFFFTRAERNTRSRMFS